MTHAAASKSSVNVMAVIWWPPTLGGLLQAPTPRCACQAGSSMPQPGLLAGLDHWLNQQVAGLGVGPLLLTFAAVIPFTG